MENIEIWKSLKFLGYPDYEVSNWGNVKSLNYLRTGKEKILKPAKSKNGYSSIVLCKRGIAKTFRLHKLIALTFIPNPENLPCINHKDENKENNRVENLEFCSARYNNNYGTRNERASKSMKGKIFTDEHKSKISKANKGKKRSEETKQKMRKQRTEETKQKISEAKRGKPQYKHRKPILQFTLDNVFLREFDSAKSASEELNIYATSITACCKGKLKTCGGFIWRYKETTI